MAADLHLFFADDALTTAYAAALKGATVEGGFVELTDELEAVTTRLWELDNTWIGAVSMLKAGLMGDERWIPPTVSRVIDLTRDNPVLTRALAADICVAFSLPNTSYYGRPSKRVPDRVGMRGLEKAQVVKRILLRNLGKRVIPELL